MNKGKLTATVHKVSKEKGIPFNMVLQVYFFERFLERLSNSQYKHCFVLKGGFLLSSLLGVTERSTIDMDFSVSNLDLNKANVRNVIEDITQVELYDEISFDMANVTEIMEFRTYVGYQISLIGKLDNIKVPFHIDLATGDPITPDKITFKYRQIIGENIIEIDSYTVETILAEKLQTIMDKRIGNSRMKDFYDIYILMKLHKDFIDVGVLSTAVKTTFEYRKTPVHKLEFADVLNDLEEDHRFVSRWNNFTKKNHYVDTVSFTDVTLEIMKLIDWIE